MIEVVPVDVNDEWLTDNSREASELNKFSFLCKCAAERRIAKQLSEFTA